MNTIHYIGFDLHKKSISFCVKTAADEIVEEGSLPAGPPLTHTSWTGRRPRFPQMNVWPSCCFGRYAGSHAVRQLIRAAPASRPHSS